MVTLAELGGVETPAKAPGLALLLYAVAVLWMP